MAKVIVGMSGGVDSAVAAYLLKKQGHDVVGMTLRTWEAEEGQENRCCEIDDARKVAWKLKIPHYAPNCVSEFSENVIGPFVDDYLHGMTPNPCVECNRFVKWERMLYMSKVLQADFIATGHYASVVRLDNGRYAVKRAAHIEKDQAYMLYKLTQEQLKATLMPLGNLTKSEVRQIAAEAELPIASKPDSQEICFVTSGSYADYIIKNSEAKMPKEGFFVDEEGKPIGRHKGIIHYTVGQRKGLGIALGYPVFVKEINAGRNEVVLGREESLYSSVIVCNDVNFMSISGLDEGEQMRCLAKVRYHHPEQGACLEMLGDGRVKVTFDEPVRAAAPGQSAVFYDGDGIVIGGGKIESRQ